MMDFSGWRMPIQYTRLIEEHNSVRNALGIFDISHMGRIEVTGEDAYDFLQYVLTYDISRLAEGEAQYSLLCYDDASIIDDTFVYRLPNQYMMVVNAANNDKVTFWLLYHAKRFNIKIKNSTDRLAMVALQGPKAEKVMQSITDVNIEKLKYHHCIEYERDGISFIISRTGYTGEDGFELFFSSDHAHDLWDEIIEAGTDYGIKPIGLGARNTLRFEACMPLYGNELSPNINPYEARLGWAVNLEKSCFIGKEALTKIKLEGISKRLVGIEVIHGGIAREGCKVFVNDEEVGYITSGMYSPSLKKKLCLGYLQREYSVIGTELDILVRKRKSNTVVEKIPFYEIKRKR